VGSLKALIAVTFAEAMSWIGLLIAMVFKYGFEMETGVEVMGRIHGFFFMAFVALLALVHVQLHWSIKKTAISFAESIPPFTGFLLGKQLLNELKRDEHRSPSPA
jgi:integral membrane protein